MSKPTYEELEATVTNLESALSTATESLANAHHVLRVETSRSKELEAQVQGLAAENAQMLRLLTDISENHGEFVNEDDDYMYASVPLDYVSEINMYVSRDVNAENPFEHTDAALAEIRNEARAEGAELCVKALVTSFDDTFADAPNICAMVAFQLRKEQGK